jgi:hypothetical protein
MTGMRRKGVMPMLDHRCPECDESCNCDAGQDDEEYCEHDCDAGDDGYSWEDDDEYDDDVDEHERERYL